MKVYTIHNEQVSTELDNVHDWQLIIPFKDMYGYVLKNLKVKNWLYGYPVVESTYRELSGLCDECCDGFYYGFEFKIVGH